VAAPLSMCFCYLDFYYKVISAQFTDRFVNSSTYMYVSVIAMFMLPILWKLNMTNYYVIIIQFLNDLS
jgi:hypothetical protein